MISAQIAEKPKPISVKSRKAKARNLQNKIRDDIQKLFYLSEHDVRGCSMGAQGADIQLSIEAKRHFNFAIECKMQNSLNIWSALAQAETHAKSDTTNPIPITIFKRDRSEIYVAIKWSDFLALYSKKR
jgi:hypothetical protein